MSSKNDSDAKKVFDMVQSLKDRYGMKEPEEPFDEEPESLDAPLAEEPAVSPEEDVIEKAAAPKDPQTELTEAAKEADAEAFEDAPEEADEEEPEEEFDEEFEEAEEASYDEAELKKAIESALGSEISEEAAPETDLPEESLEEEELPEELIYEVPKEDSEPNEKEEEVEEEEVEDEGLENQIAIDVPQPECVEPPKEEEAEPAPEEPPVTPPLLFPSAPPPLQKLQPDRAPEDYHPLRTPAPQREQKPIAAEQLSLVNPPVMKDESPAKAEESPSVESLERSVPDLSKLSDEERRRRSGLSNEDIRMMIEFGYEEDLNRVLGYRTVRKLKYSRKKDAPLHTDLRPFAYSGKEFDGSPDGRNEILRAYRKDKIFLLLRLVLTGLCALVLLILDIMESRAPSAGTMIWGILFLLATAAVSHRTLAAAIKSLVFFSPTPHSIPALLLLIALGSDLRSFIDLLGRQLIFDFSEAHLPVINFVTALVFLISVVGDLFRFSAEKHAFLVLSAASPKTAPETYIRRKKKLQRGEEIVSLIDDSPDYAEYRVRPVGRITGFFRRCGNLSDVTKEFSILLALCFGLSALGALIIWATKSATPDSGVPLAVSSFINLLFFSAPISAIFAFFYPAGLASRVLSRKRSAVIGEESVAELTRKKALLFSDSRAFKAGKCIQTPLRSDSDFKEDLRLSGILFRKLGGVLAQVATPLFPEGPDPAVSILRIREDGVEALVDNRYHLLAGSKDYLLRYGIRFPAQSDNPSWQSADSASLYVAIDDVLKLRYDVEYRRLDDFGALLQQVAGSHTTAGIYTYDPNLTEAFLRRLYGEDPAPVLVKPGAFDEETEVHVTDAPAVTLGKDESLAEPIEVASTIKRARATGFRAQLALSSAAALLVTLFSSGAIESAQKIFALGTLIAFHIASLILTWGIVTSQFNQLNPPHS